MKDFSTMSNVGVPVLPISIYTAVRATTSSDRQLLGCWVNEAESMWILLVPIMLSLVINFFFLVNILRILLSKLRANNTNESHNYRRTARACLILVPLLGVQYIIMPFQSESNDTFVYDVIRAVMNSYQGAFVALLFCFLNEEVIQCFKKQYKKWCEGNSLRSAGSRMVQQIPMADKNQTSPKISPKNTNGYNKVPYNNAETVS